MSMVDRPGRLDPTEARALSVGRPGGRPGYTCARRVHRSTAQSTVLCPPVGRAVNQDLPGLLLCAVLAPLSSDLCATFLYLLDLLSPYNSFIAYSFLSFGTCSLLVFVSF